jgi:NADH-quinone oxidoreductase subunit C
VTEIAGQDTTLVTGRLREWNAAAVESVSEFRGEITIVVPPSLLRAALAFCRGDAALQFNLLSDIVCVDHFPIAPRFEVNYHLTSIPRRDKLRIRARISGDDPVLDSATSVWPGANWMEREVFDLFGVRFAGHPDLRRILLPDDWQGHPLRKDYPVEGYR